MRRNSFVSPTWIAAVLAAVLVPEAIGVQTSQTVTSVESSTLDQTQESQTKQSVEPSASARAKAQAGASIEKSEASRARIAAAAQSVQAHPAIEESTAAMEKRAILNHSTAGTSRIALYLAENRDAQLTPEQQEKVLKALDEAQTVQDQTANRAVGPEDVERIRQAERQVVLAFWETPVQPAEKTAQLSPNQYGYVFEGRFQKLSRITAKGPADLAQALRAGSESASHLTQLTDASDSAELQRLLQTFDAASQRAMHGNLDRALVSTLKGASSDLDQQVRFYSMKSGPMVQLTVRTVRNQGAAKEEIKGYNVRYELEIDDTLGTPRGLSFTGTTTLQDRLGPFSYVLWAEQTGRPASDKKRVNLGNPLRPKQEVEIPLTGVQ